tara:strand:+ start:118 stop:588 length:471 start_codon:yes stop_codon:yes gene_type:complete
MLLVLNVDQFDNEYIVFSDKTKNNILSGGDFYRLYYADPYMTSNGLFITFSLKNVKIEKYFNKIKCSFDKVSNRKIITFIKHLERDILEISPVSNSKQPTYRIEEQLNQHYIKIFSDEQEPVITNKVDHINILLKISGIWTDSLNYGTTFRFFFDH